MSGLKRERVFQQLLEKKVATETRVFSNGLTVSVAPLAVSAFAQIGLFVRAGSRYEPKLLNGMSHLVEHMLFRGSKNYPSSHVLNDAFERLGDGLEGATTREYSVYFCEVPPDHMGETLTILQDVLTQPLFTNLEIEKDLIDEEILEDFDRDGELKNSEARSRELLFGDHPLAAPVAGRPGFLARIRTEDVQRFFQEFYQPDNWVLVASGAVDPELFFAQAEKAFGSIGGSIVGSGAATLGSSARKPQSTVQAIRVDLDTIQLPSGEIGPRVLHQEKEDAQVEVFLSFLTEGEKSFDLWTLRALERLLVDGISSRLHRVLSDQRGLVYEVEGQIDLYSDVGVFDFSFRTQPEKLAGAFRELYRELFRIKTDGVPIEELDRVITRMQREVVSFFESPRAVAHRLGECLLLGLSDMPDPVRYLAEIEKIDADSIKRLAQKIFIPERSTIVFSGDLADTDQVLIQRIIDHGLNESV